MDMTIASTILPDTLITEIMSHRVDPWDITNLNPASLDLQLGNEWIDISDSKPERFTSDVVTIYPNSTILQLYRKLRRVLKFLPRRPSLLLATTVETISIPDNVYAMVKLKTTPCRRGLGHPIADWVDPGFSGKLTLMLHAFKPVNLCSGQRVCQLVFGTMQLPAAVSYRVKGHYNNQTGPTLSWREKL